MKIINNTFKYFVLVAVILSLLVVQSCSQELDINRDPNNPTDVPINTLLTSSQVNTGYIIGGDATRMPASIVQYYSGHRGQPLDYSRYNITSSSADGLWRNAYDALMDLKEIQNKGTESGDRIYVGISQILQAYVFSVITDLFGDIPFSMALLGAENITPTYDRQETIYPVLIRTIEDGIVNVGSLTGNRPGTDDVIYNGNTDSWIRFANSLKLRLLNHLSKREPGAASAFLVTNPALIEVSTANAAVRFGTAASNANPIYQFDVLSGRKDNAIASTIVDKMRLLNDPRIDVYFTRVVNNGAGFQGQYRGNTPGEDTDDSGENLFSRVGSAYASTDSPVVLMSAAEVNFIKSEIYFRANDMARSKASFDIAIAQDFSALGLSDRLPAYIADSRVAYNNSLERIMEQKWITMFQGAYESWVDWRRTGFPVFTIMPSFNMTGNIIPRRLSYPQIEINVNTSSLQNGPGIPIPFESLKERVWWDQ
ncbi:TPA: SusD/RagB family nutrient-binding outer membrane lipoprotein [Elizabethkingia anophelis]|uniref:SusD/RagB family nutrient-binding outer membrane lipoprotein n=1 Tax=Elizabethkingia anophelis TaxID=1117645 RepID=UPI000B354DA7|nr:SusD/RagB family nutrient-binding outer membrane lipoprotein [Elizabethkingia anophelis]MDV3755810.1 SusD/RagB family nutrient-binding outer membrane lipoprotein [Elizabethkingia anophelis]